MSEEELNAILVTGMARRQADQLVERAIRHPEIIRMLFNAACSGIKPRNQKAAYAIRHITEVYPGVIKPYADDLHRSLDAANHDSIRRDILKCFLNIKDPDMQDDLADRCMGWLSMGGLDAAVKYYSAMILEEICKRWPDLNGEFKLLLESQVGHVTDNFDRFAARILKRLSSEV